MTISSSLRRAGPYNGNNAATTFPFGFKVFSKSDVRVTLTDESGIESILTLNSDYTIVLSSDQDSQPGGMINYPVSGPPLPVRWKLTASGDLQYSQPTDIQNSGGFYPQVIEDALDRLTIQTQQLAEEMGRTVKVNISDPTSPDQLFAAVLSQASGFANAAAASAGASATSADQSAQSAIVAAAARDLARAWAIKTDAPVEGTDYSARYWALQAATYIKGFPPQYRGDGTVTATTTQVTFGARAVRDAANLRDIILTAPMTKVLQTSGGWSAGNNGNGLVSGVRTAGVWYHGFLIYNDATGAVDVCFDTSPVAANRPAGWSSYRRIWSVRTNGANEIQAFIKFGSDRNVWAVRYNVANNATMSFGDLVTVGPVPLGVRTIAQLTLASAVAANGVFMSLVPIGAPPGAVQLQQDYVRSSSYQQIALVDVPTSTNAQIGFYCDVSPVAGVQIACKGYVELFED